MNNLLPPGSAGIISTKVMQYSRRAAEVSWLGVGFLVVTAILLPEHHRARSINWRVREPAGLAPRMRCRRYCRCNRLIGSLAASVSYDVIDRSDLDRRIALVAGQRCSGVFRSGCWRCFSSVAILRRTQCGRAAGAMHGLPAWLRHWDLSCCRNAFSGISSTLLQGDLWRICGGADLPALGLSVLGYWCCWVP